MIRHNDKRKVYVLPGYSGSVGVDIQLAIERGFTCLDAKGIGGAGGLLVKDHLDFENEREMHEFYNSIDDLWTGRDFRNPVSNAANLGNESGRRIIRQLACFEPMRVPKVAIEFGYDGYVGKRPKVRITPESLEGQWNKPLLMVLPHSKTRNFKSFQILAGELVRFDVQIAPIDDQLTVVQQQIPWVGSLRSNHCWFEITDNRHYSLEILLGLLTYALEIVDVMHERLTIAHLFGEIEGCPRIREYWTSPPT